MKHFLPISDRAPDHIRVVTENGAGLDTDVAYEPHDGVADVFVTARTDAVKYVLLRWNAALGEPLRILGDDWERAYGTLEWRGIVKQRSMPWYFLAAYADGVCAYGVRVRPAALCSFTADSDGITLRLDLRNGTQGVRLAGRTVKAATVVCASYEGISEFEAACRFCSVMCGDPILPERPVYGGNNWYYAYGKSSRSEILGDCRYIASLCAGNENPPHMIIDDGWQRNTCSGPWDCGNDAFGDMGTLAAEMAETGVIPGIWVRLLHDSSGTIPERQRLKGNPALLDPSHPDALAHIAADVARIRGWGFRLLKHDYSTFDIFGRYGIDMTERLTDGDWCFFDRTHTTAEIYSADVRNHPRKRRRYSDYGLQHALPPLRGAGTHQPHRRRHKRARMGAHAPAGREHDGLPPLPEQPFLCGGRRLRRHYAGCTVELQQAVGAAARRKRHTAVRFLQAGRHGRRADGVRRGNVPKERAPDRRP